MFEGTPGRHLVFTGVISISHFFSIFVSFFFFFILSLIFVVKTNEAKNDG